MFPWPREVAPTELQATRCPYSVRPRVAPDPSEPFPQTRLNQGYGRSPGLFDLEIRGRSLAVSGMAGAAGCLYFLQVGGLISGA